MNYLLCITVLLTTLPVRMVLEKFAQQQRLTSHINNLQHWQVNCSLEAAYSLLEQIVQAQCPLANRQSCPHSTATSIYYKSVLQPQSQSAPQLASSLSLEQQLLIATANTLALSIARAIHTTRQQCQKVCLPPNYSLPTIPLKYLFPFDREAQKSRNVICLFGREVKLPLTRALILEQLLQVPENTIVSQQSIIDSVYGLRGLTSEVWHAHMSYLRTAIAPELKLETQKAIGYKLIINREVLGLRFKLRIDLNVEKQQAVNTNKRAIKTLENVNQFFED